MSRSTNQDAPSAQELYEYDQGAVPDWEDIDINELFNNRDASLGEWEPALAVGDTILPTVSSPQTISTIPAQYNRPVEEPSIGRPEDLGSLSAPAIGVEVARPTTDDAEIERQDADGEKVSEDKVAENETPRKTSLNNNTPDNPPKPKSYAKDWIYRYLIMYGLPDCLDDFSPIDKGGAASSPPRYALQQQRDPGAFVPLTGPFPPRNPRNSPFSYPSEGPRRTAGSSDHNGSEQQGSHGSGSRAGSVDSGTGITPSQEPKGKGKEQEGSGGKEESKHDKVREPRGKLEWFDPRARQWKAAVRHHDIRAELQRRAQAAHPGQNYLHPDINYGDSINDTSFFLPHQKWGDNREDRPEITWQWEMKDSKKKAAAGNKPGPMMFDGMIVLDPNDDPVIDHSNIPAVLSPMTQGSKLEAMLRENPLLIHSDFLARMPRQYRQPQKEGKMVLKELSNTNSRVNMPIIRFRLKAGCQSWTRRKRTDKLREGLLKFYKYHNFDPVASGNSTKGFSRDLQPWEVEQIRLGDAGDFSGAHDAASSKVKKQGHDEEPKEAEHGRNSSSSQAPTTSSPQGYNPDVQSTQNRKRTFDDAQLENGNGIQYAAGTSIPPRRWRAPPEFRINFDGTPNRPTKRQRIPTYDPQSNGDTSGSQAHMYPDPNPAPAGALQPYYPAAQQNLGVSNGLYEEPRDGLLQETYGNPDMDGLFEDAAEVLSHDPYNNSEVGVGEEDRGDRLYQGALGQGDIVSGQSERHSRANHGVVNGVNGNLKRDRDMLEDNGQYEEEEDSSNTNKRQRTQKDRSETATPGAPGRRALVPSTVNLNPELRHARHNHGGSRNGLLSQQQQPNRPAVQANGAAPGPMSNATAGPSNNPDMHARSQPLTPDPTPTAGRIDFRTVPPSSEQERRYIDAALRPTREAFFRLTGRHDAPFTDRNQSYMQQWNHIIFCLKYHFEMLQSHPSTPYLFGLPPWYGSFSTPPPLDSTDQVYLKKLRNGYRAPQTPEGHLIDVPEAVLERLGSLGGENREMAFRGAMLILGYERSGQGGYWVEVEL